MLRQILYHFISTLLTNDNYHTVVVLIYDSVTIFYAIHFYVSKSHVHQQGLEPRTPALEGRCSIHLSYRCIFHVTRINLRHTSRLVLIWTSLADEEGFEPPEVLPSLVFKTSAISRTLPSIRM